MNIQQDEQRGWTVRCAEQLKRRWTALESEQALAMAAQMIASGWSRLAAVDAADSYVRQVEERGRIPAEKSAFRLDVLAEGVSAETLALALEAVIHTFESHGVSPAKAARGHFDRAWWDDCGFPEDERPARDLLDAAMVWDQACQAAELVCRGHATMAGSSVGLDLRWRDEPPGSSPLLGIETSS